MSSGSYPAPTREHHDTFCTRERWELVRGATGQPVRHHRTYELTLWDARVLRTRISKPVNGSTYSARMWSHVLREQLEVDAPTFWACARDGVVPDRGRPERTTLGRAVPLYLVRALTELGVSESDALDLDAAAAAQLHAELLTRTADGV